MPVQPIYDMKILLSTLAVAACAVVTGLHPGTASAQAYPSKPVKF